MYTEVINYKDFDGNDQSIRAYFNISKSELAKENLKYDGGLYEYLKRIVSSRDQLEINKYFEKIIDLSYGIRLDSNHFKKSPEILEEFKSSAAYDEWFFKLTTDEKYASKFINSVLPKEITDKEISEEDKARISEELAINKELME